MYASSAWSSASSPVAAVTPGGHDVVSSGSTTARLGWRKRWEIPVFVPRLGKSTIATVVTSEPVPDVVGSASTGRSGPGTGRPPPSGALTQSRRSPPWAPRSAQIFTGVDRRAAADSDEPVEAPVDRSRRLPDGRLGGLALDGMEHGLDAGRPQRGGELRADAGVDHEPVADDEGARDAEGAEVVARLRRGARAEDDPRHAEAEGRRRGRRGRAHRFVHSDSPSSSFTSSKPANRSRSAAVERSRATASASSV